MKRKAATSKETSRESSPKPKAGSRARSTTNVESTVEQEVQSREGQDDGVGDDDDGLKVCDQFAIAIQECGMPLGPGRKPITASDHFAIELANFCEQQATGADIMLHMDAGEVPPPLTEQRAFPALDALLAPPIDHGSITSLSTTLSSTSLPSTSLPSTGFSSATGLASAALLTLPPVVQQTPAKSPAAAPTAQNFTKEQEDLLPNRCLQLQYRHRELFSESTLGN
ncbi:unnamed protein product, partial [Mesorhabditis belari]|uniref:Uncharacterized protein n=1 Tax=Mesorhabditis belari TaxID=2138241 RepID=A0AAF3F0E8_9BILA